MPATGALIGTPASISDRLDAQTDPIEVEPSSRSTPETRRSVQGELLLARHDRQHGPCSQRTVADLPTPGESRLGRSPPLPRRHVVVVEEALGGLRAERVEQLVQACGMANVHTSRTCVSPRWKRPGAVSGRQDADLCGHRSKV